MINFIKCNPGFAVIPQVLLQSITMRTTLHSHQSLESSHPPDDFELGHRGRSEERDSGEDHSHLSTTFPAEEYLMQPRF